MTTLLHPHQADELHDKLMSEVPSVVVIDNAIQAECENERDMTGEWPDLDSPFVWDHIKTLTIERLDLTWMHS
jgi:hypothetical protein|tara:strand:+ start:29020 stop:29238 length:219 start_codon:yes stop_codon:yes gene_type:complete